MAKGGVGASEKKNVRISSSKKVPAEGGQEFFLHPFHSFPAVPGILFLVELKNTATKISRSPSSWPPMDECKVLCYIYSQHTDLFRLVAAAGAEVTVMRPMSRPQMLDLVNLYFFICFLGGI